ncbi:MAG: hypothetical protein V3S02_06295 [Dehalococcoidales bacterium]
MAIAAWVLGGLGGLSAVAGILAATEVVTFLNDLPAAFTPLFGLTLGIVLLLASIALAVSRTEYE